MGRKSMPALDAPGTLDLNSAAELAARHPRDALGRAGGDEVSPGAAKCLPSANKSQPVAQAMNFSIERLRLSGPLLVKGRRFEDPRGYFMETWSHDAFRQLGIETGFVQDNQSLSVMRGTVRGLHFQVPPFAQAKLVRVLQGSVFDVAVDLRAGSPTYGQWSGVTLTAARPEQLYIPAGFAHGFVTLAADTIVAYRVDAPYAPQCDAGIRWNDPAIGIDWPVMERDAMLSAKDAALPLLAGFRSPFVWEGLAACHSSEASLAAVSK
jgi:dTDP-4-dehydrorhamnose 3,5-epimerase